METLTIDRGEWLTGKAAEIVAGTGGTLRHAGTGLMCCLGIYAHKNLGCSLESLNGKGVISCESHYLHIDSPEWLNRGRVSEVGVGAGQDPEDALAQTNDALGLHQTRRETRIAKLFKKYGNIKVTFIGRYAEATAKAKKAYGEVGSHG